MSPEEIIAGGNGTLKITGPATITGAIAAIKCHTECPNLVLHRELFQNETAFGVGTDVTEDYFAGGSTPNTDDFIKPSGYVFGRVEIDTDEEITIIKIDTDLTIA